MDSRGRGRGGHQGRGRGNWYDGGGGGRRYDGHQGRGRGNWYDGGRGNWYDGGGGRRYDGGRGRQYDGGRGPSYRGGNEGRRGGRGRDTSTMPQPPPPPPPPQARNLPAQPPPPPQARNVPLPTSMPMTLSPSSSPAASTSSLSMLQRPHTPRPGYGLKGTEVKIVANYFKSNREDKEIHAYTVSITPQQVTPQQKTTKLTTLSTRRAVISHLISACDIEEKMFVYDGYNCCYTVGELPFQSNVELAVNITDDETGNCMEKVYTVRIEKLDDYSELPMVNATLKYKAWISGIKISKFTFSSTFGLIRMVNGLERRLGYFQNVCSTQTGPFLNFDISVGSFYPSVLLTEFVKNYLHVPDGGFLAQDFYRVQLEKALIGVYVETIHRQEGKLTYRIKGISNDPMSEIRFHVPAEGTQKTIIEYFHANYNCELKYVSWPCVVSGADSRPIYLPMEVCKIVVGQRCDQMVTTILSPNERKKHIKESFMENIYNDEYARQFGINLSNQMVYLKARVLPPPKLACIKAGAYTTFEPRGGRWNMKEMKSVTGQSVQRWAILNLSNKGHMLVSSFIQTVIRACTDIGMVFNIDDVVKPKPPGSVPIECALRKLDESVKEVTSGLQLQLLFVILPEANSSSCYGEIKKVCDTELGITSQCFLPKHVPKPQMKRPEDYFFHVALKINVKVGGCNTYVEDVMSGFDASIMIFGADVSHPRPGDTSSPSIAAVVGSLDYPQVSQYRCVTSVQDGVEEIIHDLRSMVKELLNAFKQANNHLPHRIVFFRDGVSESRYGEVWNYEVQEISKACESFQKLHIPVTFVLVLKRHHTRLFLDKENKNVYPGTVLDNTICLPDEFDFFLCSHACSVGTAKPPHYIVLHDENGFTADAIHELTSKLTYGYVRSTRALSIVTPVQYAHLAAARARHYIGPSSSVGPLRVQENIAGTMFFC